MVKAFGKMYPTEVISLRESRTLTTRLEGNSIWLDGPPLRGCTLLSPRDYVFLYPSYHSISPGFRVLTTGSWVGDAANVLTRVNIAGIFKGPRPFKSKANLCDGDCNTTGWLQDRKEAFFK